MILLRLAVQDGLNYRCANTPAKAKTQRVYMKNQAAKDNFVVPPSALSEV